MTLSARPAPLVSRPVMFWFGVALTCAGVAQHVWMFVDSASMGFHMAMMGMSGVMWAAMAAIVVGVAVSGFAVTRTAAATLPPAPDGAHPAHRRRLIGVLSFALLVDQMKPATLAFIQPGMRAEFHLSAAEISWLPTVALSGTVLGSLVGGRSADRIGRRATILIASLLFLGTTVCGAMPTFGGVLVMCALMGMAAGGMLPVVYALMTESLPPGRRAAIMVLQAGLTTTGGYMAAAGLAAVLIPLTGWRVLWFAQLPLVLILIALNRWIPESAAFTAQRARPGHVPASALFRRPQAAKTLVVSGYALAWGLVYWGFITFLPSQLEASAEGGMSAATLLFLSSLLSIPTCAVAAWLYMRWSAKGTMVVYAALTVVALLVLAAVGTEGSRAVLLTAVILLFAGTAGVIALIGPYTAEIFPLAIRGTAGGWAAAVGKSGGAFGPPLIALVLSAPGGIRTAALLVALPMTVAGVAVAMRGNDPRTVGESPAEAAGLDAELDGLVRDEAAAAKRTPPTVPLAGPEDSGGAR
ncbi:putative MFS transporter [Streptomyces sp. KhCrAH-43]|uniref:MFS transporter n=1 Tax=Streptomyces TaxID=1883 RepID=UPI00037AF9AF|nr:MULTISPECIES: MFS transporter [unclassified Streptomyces]MYS39187.1 MFS transporter [Streptomyces sp. SID4920]MYX64232.1 MFS transporter [Streptomyces sp. SID8373]RAJ48744.1 putative MFS transporter [Streptomyces sp. KhCrAH-43]